MGTYVWDLLRDGRALLVEVLNRLQGCVAGHASELPGSTNGETARNIHPDFSLQRH